MKNKSYSPINASDILPAGIEWIDGHQKEVLKCVAWIVTILQFLVTHLPTGAVSVILGHFLHAIMFSVAFAAWVWIAIKEFNEGDGVTLFALWILPILPIPRTRRIQTTVQERNEREGNSAV